MSKKTNILLIVIVTTISLIMISGYFMFPDAISGIIHKPSDTINKNPNPDNHYVDVSVCKHCHIEIDSLANSGLHKKLNCQYCHGPGYKHIVDPGKNKLQSPIEKEFCGRCHSKDSARSTEILHQVDFSKHNPGMSCNKCHDPHSPGIKSNVSASKDSTQAVALTCNTCHDEINVLQKKGKHKSLTCQKCHGQGNDHINSPTTSNITNPVNRESCNKCHANSKNATGIKQIDPKEHNPDMKCIECHLAHNPPEFK